ncbi:MAG: DUF1634 domain-containing protein [Actinomycetota bacterium]|nr:DUF1634 domain-containing protein [Actinomycetota bacterium]
MISASRGSSAPIRARAGASPGLGEIGIGDGSDAALRRIELAVSWVLRVGVGVSVLVIAAGLAIMFARHDGYLAITGHASYRGLTGAHSRFPHSLAGLAHTLARGRGQGIVVVGVVILILTPVLRVGVGVVSFLVEHDLPMALITLYVLAVLVGSFFLAQS